MVVRLSLSILEGMPIYAGHFAAQEARKMRSFPQAVLGKALWEGLRIKGKLIGV